VGITFLYLSNPLLAATAGFSWNHNLSVLCMLASFCFIYLGSRVKHPEIWFFASGVLLGIATGVRSSSITILPAYLFACIWMPGRFKWQRFIRLGLWIILGIVIALLPLLWFYVTAPQQFIFGNWTYARLNAAYRIEVPVSYVGTVPVFGAQSLAEKIGFLWNDVISQPTNILLFASLIFFGWSILFTHLQRGETQVFRNILLLTCAPLAAVGGFFPTPSWYQYFYAPLPFILLTIGAGLSSLTTDTSHTRKLFLLLLLQLALLSSVLSYKEFRRMSFLRYVGLWKPLVIHQMGKDMRNLIGPEGRVFTFAPLYALEGGLRVYPPMATGVFSYRTGSLLSSDVRQRLGIVTSENVEVYLDENPPEGILVGFNQGLEKQIIEYALDRGYEPESLDKKLTLWVRPVINNP
jgi:4-amino-4-deoxy-L-arabinose transferase-like glycosyltransferase